MLASYDNKKQSNLGNQNVQDSCTNQSAVSGPIVHSPISTPGVSNCYVFKSRLQEYAQKVGLPTPVYETIKEGPSHEPSFRSTVIINGVRYDSLPGFFYRKAAEQSAAEIALTELSKGGDKKESIGVPVHETGLCKNLLQEYAQKMNYAIPTYICQKHDKPGRTSFFSCTVEIGGIQYIGATAKTKKEAEIKAARTALLAIKSSTSVEGENFRGQTHYAVVPCKRKVSETALPQVETIKRKKPKRPRFKKKQYKRQQPGDAVEQIQAGNMGVLVSKDTSTDVSVEQFHDSRPDVQVKKPKNPRFWKKPYRQPGDAVEQIQAGNMGGLVSKDTSTEVSVEQFHDCRSDVQVSNKLENPDCLASAGEENESSNKNPPQGEVSIREGGVVSESVDHDSQSDVHVSNKLENPDCLASAGEENELSNKNQPQGEASIREGGVVSEVTVYHDSSQLAVSSCQQPWGGNDRSINSSGSSTDGNKDAGFSNGNSVTNDLPPPRQQDALVSDAVIGQGEQAPTIANTCQSGEENITGANEEPAPAIADTSQAGEENNTGANEAYLLQSLVALDAFLSQS